MTTASRIYVADVLDLVSVPEGESGRVKISKFEVSRADSARSFFAYGTRAPAPGVYTKLTRGDELWMSDTPAEQRDHFDAVNLMLQLEKSGGRVLIGGLGIGMVVQAALRAPNVAHVDVVELDEDVIALAGPHYEEMASTLGKTIRIIHGDVFDRKKLFSSEDWWDIVWMDIWMEMSEDNLPEMAKLSRMYCRFSGWIGHWGRDTIRYRQRQERRNSWY